MRGQKREIYTIFDYSCRTTNCDWNKIYMIDVWGPIRGYSELHIVSSARFKSLLAIVLSVDLHEVTMLDEFRGIKQRSVMQIDVIESIEAMP